GSEVIIIDTEFLYNSITITLLNELSFKNTYSTIHIEDIDGDLLAFTLQDNRRPYINTFSFPATKYLKITIYNRNTTDSLDYKLNAHYSHDIHNNIFFNKCMVQSSETMTFWFTDTTFLNRLSYVFYNKTDAQDYNIIVYATLKDDSIPTPNYFEILNENITGLADVVLHDTLSFTESTIIKVEIVNNNAVKCFAEVNLFFSKNLKPYIVGCHIIQNPELNAFNKKKLKEFIKTLSLMLN
ncbi:unnamed protein product, partial [marine sediment metagenome]